MNRRKLLRRTATAMLLIALVSFAAAAGIVVRDLGAFYRSEQSVGSLRPSGTAADRFYAYELPYELAVFSTVRVATVVEALFYDWKVEFESNGSLLESFRPARPGMLEVRVTNLESVNGTLSLTVLQQSGLPPDLETSLLNPLLYATVALLAASAITLTVGGREPGARD
ncbi:MAG: hypothetical protein V3U30_03220 [Thermoplasmata archaeon]